MTTPTTDWPKPYILEVHRLAVEHGLVFIEDISEAEADSFKQRFYRARRRSDKSMAAFIPPEFHLVMVGEYQPDKRRLPIIYSRLPSGRELPKIRPAEAEEASTVRLANNPLAGPCTQTRAGCNPRP
jgi:hypothetical protein